VHFKVNAPNNTIIEGIYQGGKMVKLQTVPSENKEGIEIMNKDVF
jgi:hypothetical protein